MLVPLVTLNRLSARESRGRLCARSRLSGALSPEIRDEHMAVLAALKVHLPVGVIQDGTAGGLRDFARVQTVRMFAGLDGELLSIILDTLEMCERTGPDDLHLPVLSDSGAQGRPPAM